MTFDEFKSFVLESDKPADRSNGQHAWIRLHVINSDLAMAISGGGQEQRNDVDPFYNDKNLPRFWQFVEANW